jgi:bifunctional non-homologous end joining protein LigD
VTGMELPYFVKPMLAVHGAAFDSPDYIFELKWDGYRAIAIRDSNGYRLMSRNGIDLASYYPELGFLGSLPPGTILDGELVALVNGKADFGALGSSRQADARITYFAFDVLYRDFEPRMSLPLMDRKKILDSLVSPFAGDRLAINLMVDTHGKLFFDKVRSEGLEGIMAKHKESLYIPGKREATWKKIKSPSEIVCVIIGFVPNEGSFKSLLLAAEVEGKLRYVGKVGTGFTMKLKETIFRTLVSLVVSKPIVECKDDATWIKPDLYCRIGFTEFTHEGLVRAPVFRSMINQSDIAQHRSV